MSGNVSENNFEPAGQSPAVGSVVSAAEPAAGSGAPSGYAWAQQTEQVLQQTEPLKYHRLYRGMPVYAWWKPLLATVTAAAIYVFFSIFLGLVSAAIIIGVDDVDGRELLATLSHIDTQNPLSLLFILISLIVLIPAALLALRIFGITPIGRVFSVVGRLRFGLLGKFTLLAFVFYLIYFSVNIVLGFFEVGGDMAKLFAFVHSDYSVSAAILSFVFIILLVPFQAAAEEIVFRGLLLQTIGGWIKNPIVAVAITTLLFTVGHTYDIWGLLSVAVLGVCAAILTLKTGGLEAAIALHVINNVFSFGMLTLGLGGTTKQQMTVDGGLATLIFELALTVVFTLAALFWAKRVKGLQTSRIDSVFVRVPVASTPQQSAGAVG